MMSLPAETRPPHESTNDVFSRSLTEDYLHLARFVWRRKLVLGVGLILGIGLGVLACFLVPPAYESQARLIVSRKWPRALPLPSADPQLAYLPDYLSSHEALLTSPLIAGRAVLEGNLAGLASLQPIGENFDPAASIVGGLEASRDAKNAVEPNSAVLNVSYSCSCAEDAPVVLSAVINSYKSFLAESHRHDSEKIAALFTQWKDEVQDELSEKRNAYQCLRSNIPPELWKGNDGMNLAQQRLNEIRAQHLVYLLRATVVRARLSVIQAARDEGANPQVLVELVQQWTNQNTEQEGSDFRDQLSSLLLEEKDLRETYGPSHPLVRAVQERIRLAQQLYLGAPGDNPEEILDSVETYTEYLKQELAVSQKLEQSLATLAEEESGRAKKTDEQSEDIADLREDIARARKLENEIVARLQEVEILKDSGSVDAQVIAAPGPGKPVLWRTPVMLIGLASLIGLALGGGLAAVAEAIDRRFRTQEEIHQALGMPVVGAVPLFHPPRSLVRKVRSGSTALDPLLFAYHAPDGAPTEAVRGVRAVLALAPPQSGPKIIVVTSPQAADGRTVVSANLAVLLAQSGSRTILIDADLRHPAQHVMFGLSAPTGLAAVLSDEVELADAVEPGGIPNLDVLPAGSLPASPGELLASPRFRELLDSVREQYDYAVIDTAPVLAASDPRIVAPWTDGMLLVLRNGKRARTLASRVRLLINPLKVHLLGVVVNPLTRRSGLAAEGLSPRRGRGMRRTAPLRERHEPGPRWKAPAAPFGTGRERDQEGTGQLLQHAE